MEVFMPFPGDTSSTGYKGLAQKPCAIRSQEYWEPITKTRRTPHLLGARNRNVLGPKSFGPHAEQRPAATTEAWELGVRPLQCPEHLECVIPLFPPASVPTEQIMNPQAYKFSADDPEGRLDVRGGSMAEGIAPASKTHGLTPIVCSCPSCIMFQVHAAFLIDAAGRVVQQDGEGQKSWA
jgi:hypothetical protein